MPEPVAQTNRPLPRLIAVGPILLGTLLWFVVVNHPARPARFWVAAAVCVLPFCFRTLRETIDRLSTATGRAPRWLIPLCVFAIAWAALYAEAIYDQRGFAPGWHDEFSYLFQARTFASGRLWLPALAPEIRDAFDTFYILVAPTYASQYFPGTALLLLPGTLAGAPAWATPITLCAGSATLAFIVGRQLSRSTLIALAAAVGVLCAFPTRIVSVVAISQPPTMFLATLAYVAFLGTLGSPRKRWLALLGVATGWLLITRPVDALGLLAPIWLALAWQFVATWWRGRRDDSSGNPQSHDGNVSLPIRIAALVAPVVPFVAFQLVINVGVTGSALQTPFELYAQRDMKGAEWSLFRDATWGAPESVVPQKHASYAEWTSTSFANRLDRAAETIGEMKFHARRLTSDTAALAVVPLGIAAMMLTAHLRRTALPIGLGLPLWFALYVGYPALRVHYLAAVVPAAAVLVAVGFTTLRERFGQSVTRPAVAIVIAWSILSLPAFDRSSTELFPKSPVSQRLLEVESTLPDRLSLVFVSTPASHGSADDEPVFNWRAAALEQNRFVRAHDLGEASRRAVIAHFATRQPDRMAYRFDRETGQLQRLGTCGELANQKESSGS